MMDKILRGTLIPKELENILGGMIYEAYARGAPVEQAIREGIKEFNSYWEKKNADQSGD